MTIGRLGVAAAILLASSCAKRPGPAAGLLEEFEYTRVFWQQLEVAKKIAALHDASVLPRLEPWLSRDDRHLRGNAAYVFARLGDGRGFNVIIGILHDDSFRGEAQGVPLLAKERWSLDRQIAADRYYAVHLLGQLKDPAAVPALVALLQDPDVNYNVPWALGEIGGDRAVAGLIDALGNGRPEVRVFAIKALEKLRARQAVPHLRRLLNDNQKSGFGEIVSVGDAARAAIASIGK